MLPDAFSATTLLSKTECVRLSEHDDSHIRKAAIKYQAPYITTVAASVAAARGMEAFQKEHGDIRYL
jgi:carbamoyl-phosphate synthase large subunit